MESRSARMCSICLMPNTKSAAARVSASALRSGGSAAASSSGSARNSAEAQPTAGSERSFLAKPIRTGRSALGHNLLFGGGWKADLRRPKSRPTFLVVNHCLRPVRNLPGARPEFHELIGSPNRTFPNCGEIVRSFELAHLADAAGLRAE